MKTMRTMKSCGSIKSMCHVVSRPYEDKSVPHLTLYVYHMNKTKLIKERETLTKRLDEVNKQIRFTDENIARLQPKLGLPKQKRRGKKEADPYEREDEGKTKKRRVKRMGLSF